MGDSVFINIDDDAWTEISTAGVRGLITNNGPQGIFILEATVNPTSSINNGHRLTSENYFRYAVTSGQKIFARSQSGQGIVIVTPD